MHHVRTWERSIEAIFSNYIFSVYRLIKKGEKKNLQLFISAEAADFVFNYNLDRKKEERNKVKEI